MTIKLKRNLFLFFMFTFIIVAFDVAVVSTDLFNEHQQWLTLGIILDFLIAIPLLLYLLYFRQQSIHLIKLIPLLFVAYVLLLAIIPSQAQPALHDVGYVIISLELVYIGYAAFKLYKSLLFYKNRKKLQHQHPIAVMRQFLKTTFGEGRLTALMVHDLSILYYLLFSWRKGASFNHQSNTFTYHKESNWLIIILFICKLLIIEGILFHFLLAQWSSILAWIFSIGNLYFLLMLIADYRAICLNPILVKNQELTITYGIQMSCELNIADIETVEPCNVEKLEKDQLKQSFTPLAVQPNVLIKLHHKHAITQLLGRVKNVDHIYLHVDQPIRFVQACHQVMKTTRDAL